MRTSLLLLLMATPAFAGNTFQVHRNTLQVSCVGIGQSGHKASPTLTIEPGTNYDNEGYQLPNARSDLFLAADSKGTHRYYVTDAIYEAGNSPEDRVLKLTLRLTQGDESRLNVTITRKVADKDGWVEKREMRYGEHVSSEYSTLSNCRVSGSAVGPYDDWTSISF